MKLIMNLLAVFIFLFTFAGTVFRASAVENHSASITANITVVSGKESVISLAVANNNGKTHQYKLTAQSLPVGFTAWFTHAGIQTDLLELKPYENCILECHISAPAAIQPDLAAFQINLAAEDGSTVAMPVSITVNRDYALEISGGVKNLEMMSGQSMSIDIAVINTGSKELKSLVVKDELPYKWLIESTTPEIITLAPGGQSMFKLDIAVPPGQASGNFSVKMIVLNSDATSNEIVIPVTVKASVGFAWWIAGLVTAVVVTTVLYFRKKGRR